MTQGLRCPGLSLHHRWCQRPFQDRVYHLLPCGGPFLGAPLGRCCEQPDTGNYMFFSLFPCRPTGKPPSGPSF